MLVLDWSINFGHFLTMIVLGAGGVGFVYTMRGRLDGLSNRMLEIEKEMHQLVTILIEQGKQDERLRALDARQQSQGARLDELASRFTDFMIPSRRNGKPRAR